MHQQTNGSTHNRNGKPTISKFEWGFVVGLWLVTPQTNVHTMTFAKGMCGLGLSHTRTQRQKKKTKARLRARQVATWGALLALQETAKCFGTPKNVIGDSALDSPNSARYRFVGTTCLATKMGPDEALPKQPRWSGHL